MHGGEISVFFFFIVLIDIFVYFVGFYGGSNLSPELSQNFNFNQVAGKFCG